MFEILEKRVVLYGKIFFLMKITMFRNEGPFAKIKHSRVKVKH